MFSVCEHDLAQKCLWTALTCLEVAPELRELFLPLRIGNPLYVLAVRHCTGCEMMKVSGRHAPLPLCPRTRSLCCVPAWDAPARSPQASACAVLDSQPGGCFLCAAPLGPHLVKDISRLVGLHVALFLLLPALTSQPCT